MDKSSIREERLDIRRIETRKELNKKGIVNEKLIKKECLE